MGKKFITNEQVVMEKLVAGVRQREIAAELGVSRQWVALFAKRNGLNRPKAGRPSRYDHAAVMKMLSEGRTYEEIAKEIGAASPTAVRAALRYQAKKAN
jgi:hypothetical protein